MPKNTRRVTFTRTVVFTATIDTPGRPEETDANMLTALGGAAGTFGPLSIAQLLAGSPSNAGSINISVPWTWTGTSLNVEPYTTRPQNALLTVGQRIASLNPVSGNEGARSKLFVVTVASSPTANSAIEPTWSLTNGATTTDGGITYRTIPKFPTLNTFAAVAYAVGDIIRPTGTSLKEFLVTTAGTATTAPTWTSVDAVGNTSASGPVAMLCIAGITLYAFDKVFGLGEMVKPAAANSQEFICTAAGTSDTNALDTGSPTVGATVQRGSAYFKRLV